ncbi:MAG: DUF4163 domain-containing protein [Leeuwenhoekiella sp.]
MFNRFYNQYKPFILILFTAVCLVSCEQEPDLQFTQKSYSTASLEACNTERCPKIDVQTIIAQGEKKLVNTINDTLNKNLIYTMSMSPDDEKNITNVDEGIALIIANFRDFKADFPESAADYEIKVSTSISAETNNLVSIAVDSYTYWGGAHGYGSVSYFNFDKNSGEYLTPQQLISNKPEILKEAEVRFRKQQKISPSGNINSTGYFFEDDKFVLPQGIGFDEQNLILQYNPYEVAAYSVGQITIKIPLEEVKDYLSIDL